MPKWERKPGEYRRRKPDPAVRGETTKQRLYAREINPAQAEQLEDELVSELRSRWKSARPRDLETLENCGECQRCLDELRWESDPTEGTIEPIFDACGQHPDLVEVWVYDLLWDLGFVQQ